MKVTRKFSRYEQEELVKSGVKGCSQCGEVLLLKYFHKTPSKLGYRSCCSYCVHVKKQVKIGKLPKSRDHFFFSYEARMDRKRDGKGRIRSYKTDRMNQIIYNYKVDFKTAKKLYDKSKNGNCDICNKSSKDNGKSLAIDHCHSSGKVRGVLCNLCNSGLGKFLDNTEFLSAAIKYLDAH